MPTCISKWFCFLASLAVMGGFPAAAGNWPQFRGPGAGGIDASASLPLHWDLDTGENILWQTPIPGLAHACPIVWDQRVYVTTAIKPGASELRTGLYGDIDPVEETEPQEWRLLALDRSNGKILWDMLALKTTPKVKRHPKASHCNSTPATDGKRIVAILGSEGLFCFDLKGKLVWKKDLGPMDSGFFAVPSAQWGFGSSPIIRDGKVIVLCDVQTNSFIAAFELTHGREVWRTPRRDVPTWSTPTVIEGSGRAQIAVNGWHETGGYDLDTGRNLWRMDGGGDIPVPTPVSAHGLVYFTSAHENYRPLRAIRPDATGDITPTDPGQTNQAIVWAHARQGNYMQTPIVVGSLLFACQDIGLLSCVDAKTGAIQYSERLASGQGFTSSPVSDGQRIYFASEAGKVFVVEAAKEFRTLATNDLREASMSTPAVSNGTIFYRTRSKLIAIGRH